MILDIVRNYYLKRIGERLAGAITRQPQRRRLRQHSWSIGVFVGDSPLTLKPPDNITNPVLTRHHVTDVDAVFVADPFMIHASDRWYMFFEVVNRVTKKGEIGLATSKDGFRWCYERIVLAEPFHLSYPYVFEANGTFYMVPESHKASAVRLYKAEAFPTNWKLVANLLHGAYFADSSLFQYRGRWWLFAETNANIRSDTLRLFYADELTGPWKEHSMSPVVNGDGHFARPAGRVLVEDNRIIRFAQDCEPVYGTRVYAFDISELSERSYTEKLCSDLPILEPSGTGWNACGMHHLDPHMVNDHSWIACVDGWIETNA